MLDNLKNFSKTVGIKQSVKALKESQVKTVIIAKDADEKAIRNIIDLCQDESLDVIYADTMKQLGKAAGIEVGAAVVCLLK